MKSDKSFFRVFYGAFCGFGLLFLIVGGILFGVQNNFNQKAQKIQGIIQNIERTGSAGGSKSRSRVHYTVYVTYEYEGEVYSEIPLSSYSSSMREGEKITLMVNQDDPYDVQTTWEGTFLTLVFSGMGLLFFLIGFFIFLACRKKEKKRERIIKEGQQIKARVDSYTLNESMSANGSHPYRMHCSCLINGQVYSFESQNLWQEPTLRYPVGSIVTIYVNPADFQEYYIDVN